MHCKTRENWPFSGLFFDFRVILTSGGYLLKLTLKDSSVRPSKFCKKKNIWESEKVAANRVAAINPPIDDTDPIRKFSIDPGIHKNLQNPVEFSKREADMEFQYRPLIVDTDTIADAILADATSETLKQAFWHGHAAWTSTKFNKLTGRKKGGFVIKGGFGECTLVPVFVPGEHANVPSFRFLFRGNIRMYPSFRFLFRGTSAKTTLLENHLFCQPPNKLRFEKIRADFSKNRKWDRQTGVRESHPYRRYEPDTEIQYRLLDASKTNEQTRPQLTCHCRESRRKADTEFQYRPRIVDTDIDCGPRFCRPGFRESYSRGRKNQ